MQFGKIMISTVGLGFIFAVALSSGSYKLPSYGYGSGGTSNATSTNYGLNATTGQVSSGQASGTTYKAGAGQQNAQQAHVPTIALTNPANYYNRLKFVITPGDNPSDTLFSIAISSDGFTTTQYIQSDNTIGATRPLSAYQTYAAWGGGSGGLVLGLQSSTTYSVKVNAFQGRFTETAYGPVSTAATVNPSITFDIDVSATNSETAAPYSSSLGNLLPATVVTGSQLVWIDLDTNAVSGASVYVRSANGGLKSANNNYTISSATTNLASASTGYGAQGASVAQSSGGPLSISSPYNVSSQNVGVLNTTATEIFASTTAINGGRGSLYILAKAAAQTPAANDYTDTLTFTTAGSF